MLSQKGGTARKPFRVITVIGIQHTDETTILGQLQTPVQGDVRPLVLLFDELDPRIVESANDVDRIVSRSVVDDHESLRWKRLPQDRSDCFRDIFCMIVRRDDASDFLIHSSIAVLLSNSRVPFQTIAFSSVMGSSMWLRVLIWKLRL